ncbi:MAG: Rne/Rng family ribonuclease [Phycisphaerae bacterium]
MLINDVRSEECRIAIVNNGKLDELFSERASAESHVGNIYKGRITNVEPSIQAAFIDFGFEKNGFLHISDVHPQYFSRPQQQRRRNESVKERVGQKTPRRERPPIQHCLRRGQEVVVQMTKEGIGSKGPTLTTYISIPGRYLVMMPGMSRLGISRKIEDEEVRTKLRQVVSELELPDNIGFIVRTAGIDRSKRELQRDLNYLKRLWKVVQHRINTSKSPVEVYQESDLVTRTIRDIFTPEIERIIVDDPQIAQKARDFLGIVMPRYQERVELYEDKIPLFYKYTVEDQLIQITSRRVDLASGGFIVIDQAEALVAIDVNSGKFKLSSDAERTALEINLEAADEIMRQLKLRDMGGVIVIDFIDMRMENHRREVERTVREALKNDRAKTKVLKMSQFGIIELTRQRVRPSRERSLYVDCSYCGGAGQIKTPESISLDIMRLIQLALYQQNVELLEVTLPSSVFEYLHNRRNRELLRLEEDTKKKIRLYLGKDLSPEAVGIKCFDVRDQEIPLEHIGHLPGIKDAKIVELRSSHVRPRHEEQKSGRHAPEIEYRPPEELVENDTLMLENSTPLDEE